MSYIVPSKIAKSFFPGIWEISTNTKEVFLTFDDGPIPELTPQILSILEKYGVKATFFCVGDNVRKYPQLYKEILSKGHAVGNHTYSHLKGWKCNASSYIKDVKKAEKLIDSRLFRPPYGKMTLKQSRILKELGYKTIMWSILSMDFKTENSPNDCFQIVFKNTKPGSIIVFHDNLKAMKNVLEILPKVIEQFRKQNFQFAILDNKIH